MQPGTLRVSVTGCEEASQDVSATVAVADYGLRSSASRMTRVSAEYACEALGRYLLQAIGCVCFALYNR